MATTSALDIFFNQANNARSNYLEAASGARKQEDELSRQQTVFGLQRDALAAEGKHRDWVEKKTLEEMGYSAADRMAQHEYRMAMLAKENSRIAQQTAAQQKLDIIAGGPTFNKIVEPFMGFRGPVVETFENPPFTVERTMFKDYYNQEVSKVTYPGNTYEKEVAPRNYTEGQAETALELSLKQLDEYRKAQDVRSSLTGATAADYEDTILNTAGIIQSYVAPFPKLKEDPRVVGLLNQGVRIKMQREAKTLYQKQAQEFAASNREDSQQAMALRLAYSKAKASKAPTEQELGIINMFEQGIQ